MSEAFEKVSDIFLLVPDAHCLAADVENEFDDLSGAVGHDFGKAAFMIAA